MSDATRAIEAFRKHYKGEEVHFRRPVDRGLPPVGGQDPDRVVSFRCSKCAASHTEEAMARRGFVHERHVAKFEEGYTPLDKNPDDFMTDNGDDGDDDNDSDTEARR